MANQEFSLKRGPQRVNATVGALANTKALHFDIRLTAKQETRLLRLLAKRKNAILRAIIEPPRPEGRGFLDYAQRYSAHVSV